MAKFLDRIFGTYSERQLKAIYPIADKILSLENEYRALTDAQLRGKTDEFRQRFANGESLDSQIGRAHV